MYLENEKKVFVFHSYYMYKDKIKVNSQPLAEYIQCGAVIMRAML